MGDRPADGASASDVERFDALYREHAGRVFGFCLRRTGDRAVADDLCSAVFYEAWRRRHEVDLVTRAALPWLYGVAGNVLRNHARSVRRRNAAVRRLSAPIPEADFAEEVPDRLYARERAAMTVALVNGLPASERAVVVLCLVDELSYSAAASALDLPVGTVRSRLFRARARLSGASAAIGLS
jgi:RNA polymerase sigma factor (sigma-70 family)